VAIFLIMGQSHGGTSLSAFRIIRVFRALRVARTARLLRLFPEFMVLVAGTLQGIRSVVATLGLLSLLIYVFAILFTQLLQGTTTATDLQFDGVMQSMNTLMLQGIFADQAQMITSMLEAGWVEYFVFLVYMVVGSLTLLNMLLGVICDVVGDVASENKEQVELKNVNDQITHMLEVADDNDDNEITRGEFASLFTNKEHLSILKDELEVDVSQLIDSADFLFRKGDSVDISEFKRVLLQLRGSKHATVKDLLNMQSFVHFSMDQFSRQVENVLQYGTRTPPGSPTSPTRGFGQNCFSVSPSSPTNMRLSPGMNDNAIMWTLHRE